MADPLKCQTCSTVIQPATAERTDGLCMPCAMGADPTFADKVEAEKGSATGKDYPLWKQVRDLIVILLVGGVFMAVLFVAKVVVSLIAALIAKFVFKTDWLQAVMIGAGTFAVLGFIGMLSDLDWSDGRPRPKAKKSKM
ncbi:MAG TPA: hypothetical protein VGH19_08875 [Verrucomicrobiae bacterium]